ncbi:MAG: hypothetical protein RRY22_04760 [Bacilli bacterium]
MKNNNKVMFIVIILITIWLIFPFVKRVNKKNKIDTIYETFIYNCKNDDNFEDSIPYGKERCRDAILEGAPKSENSIEFFYSTILYEEFRAIYYLFPILIFFLSSYAIYKELSNGFYKNMLMREGYKEYIKSKICSIYKYSLVIPIVLTIFFIICICYCNTSLKDQLIFFEGSNNANTVKYGYFFIIGYIFNIFLYGVFLTNWVMLFIKKGYNYIVTIVGAYLSYYLLLIILENFLSYLLAIITRSGIWFNCLSFSNYWSYDYGCDVILMSIIMLILNLGSGFFLFKSYCDKEKVIISNE